MPKRLAIDVRLAATGGGISRYIDGMVSNLAKSSQCDLFLYGSHDQSPYSIGRYRKLPGSFLGYYFWHLPKALEDDKIDALFAPSAFAPMRRVCRTVTVLYDLYAFKFRSLLPWYEAFSVRGLSYQIRAALHLLSLRQADTIVSISNSTAKDLQAISRRLAAHQEVIYCDVPGEFREAPVSRQRYILYVGSFNTHKNVHTLVEAHAILNRSLAEPVRLVLAGRTGWPPVDLDAIVRDAGYKDLVTIFRDPTDAEIVNLYQRCAVFAYISLYEGFGMPILEAIRCGAPVIVNNASAMPELVPLAECRVDALSAGAVASALQRMLNSDTRNLINALQEHAKRFSFEKAAARVADLLFL